MSMCMNALLLFVFHWVCIIQQRVMLCLRAGQSFITELGSLEWNNRMHPMLIGAIGAQVKHQPKIGAWYAFMRVRTGNQKYPSNLSRDACCWSMRLRDFPVA